MSDDVKFMLGGKTVKGEEARKASEFGAAPQNLGVAPKFNIELAGRPEAFRTSDGTAVPVKESLGKARPRRTS